MVQVQHGQTAPHMQGAAGVVDFPLKALAVQVAVVQGRKAQLARQQALLIQAVAMAVAALVTLMALLGVLVL